MRFRFIEAHRKEHRVRRMCSVLEVSPAGFYAWRRRGTSRLAQDDATLGTQIDAVFLESRRTYGSPRIHAVLRDRGHRLSRKRVARLMREKGITPRVRRRTRATTTDSRHPLPVAPNRLNRDFSSITVPNTAWVADITYIATLEGFLYLAVVLDLATRRVLGLAMSSRLDTGLVVEALALALGRCGERGRGVLHHSDRGVQYASREYQAMLVENGLVCSMSRKGDCYDNAIVESFFHTLKTELVHRQTYATHEDARASLFEYIEVFYNRRRLHSAIGYRAPVDVFNEAKSG
jgi:transposase InsO family protein